MVGSEASLPAGPWSTVVADPPWSFRDRLDSTNRSIRGAANHYATMNIQDICALGAGLDLAQNAHLYLWVPSSFIEEGYMVARAWGFEVKTMMTWVKVSEKDPHKLRIGMGFYMRKCTEHILFAVRGSLRLKVHNIPDVFFAPRSTHSAKPDAFYDIVRRASYTPALELFSRIARPDFVGWGDQYPGSEVAV